MALSDRVEAWWSRFPWAENCANLDQRFLHTKLITVFRGAAALEVFVGHVRNHSFPDYKLVAAPNLIFKLLVASTGYGRQAVMVFFVMSGWLVGGSFLNRVQGHKHEGGALINYAIDRLSRLWIVLIPALLLTLGVGLFLNLVLGQTSVVTWAELSVPNFFGNLVGLQMILLPCFGGNYALWSLANETWYYVLFPLLVIPFMADRPLVWKIIGLTVFWGLIWALPHDIVIYFQIWLVGVCFSRIDISGSRWRALFLFSVFGVFSLVVRWYRFDGSFSYDFLIGLFFAIFLASTKFKVTTPIWLRPWEKMGQILSEFSFSLYVLHVPLVLLLVGVFSGPQANGILDPSKAADWIWFGGFLVFIFGVSYIFYLLFESRTHVFRRYVKGKITDRLGIRRQGGLKHASH